MSRLFHTESGRIIFHAIEEVSRYRRARKVLTLPSQTGPGGTLYLFGSAHPGQNAPLQVTVNGKEFNVASVENSRMMARWFALDIGPGVLREGRNSVDVWCDTPAMDGWMLGLEDGHQDPQSFLSLDGGKTFHNDRMGVYHRMRGEYVIRLRLDDPSLSDEPPGIAWEAPDCPRFKDILEALPSEIKAMQDPWEQARALASWTIQQWEYRNTRGGVDYAPWDPLTIMSWGKSGFGHMAADPIVMCVQYAVVFTCAAMALGIPGRNVCCTEDLNTGAGHFVSEVWMEKWQKWCHVDGTHDLVFVKDGAPLSVGELHSNLAELERYAVRGTGFGEISPERRKKLGAKPLRDQHYYRYWAVWPRNDYLSHPELTPPAHGATHYVESDWLWQVPDDGFDFGMFSSPLERDGRDPPPPEWRAGNV